MSNRFQLMEPIRPLLGLVRNAPPESMDPNSLLTAHNVKLSNGQYEKIGGWTLATQVVGAVSLIIPVRYRSGSVTTLVCTSRNIYRYANGVASPINGNPFTMASDQRWEADYLAGKWWFTNQADGLWTWDGVNQMVQVATGSPGAAHLAQYVSHIILANLATNDAAGAYSVLGSGLQGADFATADPNSDAVVFEVPDNASEIQRILRIQNMLAMYKEDCIVNLSHLGTDRVYNDLVQEPARGCMSPNSVVDIGGQHVYLGQDNLYGYDGSSNLPFGDRVWNYINGLILASAKQQVWGTKDQRSAFRQVNFGYQSAAGAAFDQALTWSYQYDAFMTRDYPFSAIGYVRKPSAVSADLPFGDLDKPMGDDAASVQDVETLEDYALLAGDLDGNLWLLDDTVATANGAALVATIETADMAYGALDQVKVCNGLGIDCPSLTGTALQVYVSVRKRIADPVVYRGPFTYSPTQQWVNFMAADVWHRYKFVKTDGTMVYRGFAPRIKLGGYF